jgi:hypothetical protein
MACDRSVAAAVLDEREDAMPVLADRLPESDDRPQRGTRGPWNALLEALRDVPYGTREQAEQVFLHEVAAPQ